MSNEIATALLLALIAFWRELATLFKLLVTKRERAVTATVQEASELQKAMVTLGQMGADFGQVVKEFNVEREMYRKRQQEQDDSNATQVRALEKSLIDSQEEIKNLREHIDNLLQVQEKLKADYTIQERTVEEQGKRIKSLEDSEKQAHRLVVEKDIKINELEKRVKELEAEITRLKATQHQQAQPSVEALVIAMGATSEPLKSQPDPAIAASETPEPSHAQESADADA